MARDSTKLTERQAECLGLIRAAIAKGYPPTIRELGDRMGIRSTNGVIDHLIALERKGHIVRDSMNSRGIRLTTETVRVEAIRPLRLSTRIWRGWAGTAGRQKPPLGGLIVVRGMFEHVNLAPNLPGMVRRGRYLYVLTNALPDILTMLQAFGFQEWAYSSV